METRNEVFSNNTLNDHAVYPVSSDSDDPYQRDESTWPSAEEDGGWSGNLFEPDYDAKIQFSHTYDDDHQSDADIIADRKALSAPSVTAQATIQTIRAHKAIGALPVHAQRLFFNRFWLEAAEHPYANYRRSLVPNTLSVHAWRLALNRECLRDAEATKPTGASSAAPASGGTSRADWEARDFGVIMALLSSAREEVIELQREKAQLLDEQNNLRRENMILENRYATVAGRYR